MPPIRPTTVNQLAGDEPALGLDAPGPHAARRSRSRRATLQRRALAGGDAVGIAVGLAVSLYAFGSHHHADDLIAGLVTLPLWILLLKIYGLYDADGKRVSHCTVDDVPWVFHAMVFGALALWTVFRATPLEKINLEQFVAFVITGWVCVLLARAATRRIFCALVAPERVLLVTDEPLATLLVRKMRGHPEYRLAPSGYLDVSDRPGPPVGGEVACLGRLDDFDAVTEEAAIERIVAGPSLRQTDLIDLVRRASARSIPVSLVPSMVDVLGPSVEIDDIEGITILGINPPALTRSSRGLKRGMDLLLASTAMLVALPVMLVVALLVRLTSSGPALFTQERVGRRGRRFRVLKFRTMVVDAEAMQQSLRAQSGDPHWLLLDRDPRITSVGRFLRHTSLDELPQLLNVIRGEMSLVGPRPLTVGDHAQVSEWGRRRLDLTPGITGVWQVLGRARIPFDEMVKLDYLYVTNWSLWGDVRLLIRTLPSVLRRRGAN